MTTWRERIVAARERGRFTDKDCTDSLSWCLCAVGEHHAAHPTIVRYTRGSRARPKDDRLADWGSRFSEAIYTNNFARAELLLNQIEDRVLTLKREETHC